MIILLILTTNSTFTLCLHTAIDLLSNFLLYLEILKFDERNNESIRSIVSIYLVFTITQFP